MPCCRCWETPDWGAEGRAVGERTSEMLREMLKTHTKVVRESKATRRRSGHGDCCTGIRFLEDGGILPATGNWVDCGRSGNSLSGRPIRRLRRRFPARKIQFHGRIRRRRFFSERVCGPAMFPLSSVGQWPTHSSLNMNGLLVFRVRKGAVQFWLTQGESNRSQGGGGRSRLAKTLVSVVEYSLANLLRPLLSHHRPVNDYPQKLGQSPNHGINLAIPLPNAKSDIWGVGKGQGTFHEHPTGGRILTLVLCQPWIEECNGVRSPGFSRSLPPKGGTTNLSIRCLTEH